MGNRRKCDSFIYLCVGEISGWIGVRDGFVKDGFGRYLAFGGAHADIEYEVFCWWRLGVEMRCFIWMFEMARCG